MHICRESCLHLEHIRVGECTYVNEHSLQATLRQSFEVHILENSAQTVDIPIPPPNPSHSHVTLIHLMITLYPCASLYLHPHTSPTHHSRTSPTLHPRTSPTHFALALRPHTSPTHLTLTLHPLILFSLLRSRHTRLSSSPIPTTLTASSTQLGAHLYPPPLLQWRVYGHPPYPTNLEPTSLVASLR